MIAEIENTLPTLHIRTVRKRTAFATCLLFFHWAFLLSFGASEVNIIGLGMIAAGGIFIYPWRPIALSEGMKAFFWGVYPVFYGLALALLSHQHGSEVHGLLPISLNFLCFTFVPLGFYRILSPLLMFCSVLLGLTLLNEPFVFGNGYLALLLGSNLAMSWVGWRISTWLLDVHRARINQAPMFGKAELGSQENISKTVSQGQPAQAQKGFILQFDLRGFSAFVREVDENVYEEFMHSYYEIVSMAVGQNRGTIHRTSGDCHVICFGIFSDKTNPPSELLMRAKDTFEFVVHKLADLSHRMKLEIPLTLGGALDYGDIRVRIFGHEFYQQEIDLVGSVLIRCARLEAHTKVIMSKRLVPKSMLIYSADAMPHTQDLQSLDIFSVRDQPVRDFPQLRWLAFQEFEGQKLGLVPTAA